MHNFQISEHLQEILKKLVRKDKSLYEQLIKKMEEVIESYEVGHYKNLRYDMKDSKRNSRFRLSITFKK